MNLLLWLVTPIALLIAIAVAVAAFALGVRALLPAEHPLRATLLAVADRSPQLAGRALNVIGNVLFWGTAALLAAITFAFS